MHPALRWYYLNGGGGEAPLDLIQTINSFQSPTGKTYIQKINSLYRIWSPINDEWAQVYSSAKELSPDDDQWESVASWGLMRYYEVRLPDSKTGTWSGGGIIAASVAQTIDCTLTISFTGTGIKFMSYRDSGAGQYTWSINSGEYTGSIDLEQVSAGFGLTTIIEGLPYGTYSLTMAIVAGMGNPYAALQNSIGSGFDEAIYLKCFYIIGSQTPNCCHSTYSNDIYNPMTACRGGHQFFAFSTKGTSDVGINNWIPNHSTVEFASIFDDLATDRLLRLDDAGDNKITTLAGANCWFAQEGTSVVLRQNFTGVNKDFPATLLFDIQQVVTWNSEGITIYMRAEAIDEIDNSVLYTTMHDQSTYESTGKLRYTYINGVEYDNETHGGSVNRLNAAAMQTWNGEILGLDKTGSDFDKSVVSATKIYSPSDVFPVAGSGLDSNNVDANTAKYYPFLSQNSGVIADGTVYEWTAKAVMGFVPDAYNELSDFVV